jgi:simple sugar transport system permease protein
VLTGLSITITKGGAISGFPKPFLFIGNGDIFGVPMPFIIFIICAAVIALILRKSRLGFNMYMIGSNERATLFSGINNSVVLVKVYLLSGFLSGLAALVMTARFNSAKASYGLSYLLLSVLVVLLGGASAYGGTGNVLGIVVALFLMQLFSSSFNLMGFSTFLTTAIWGMVLVFVMMARGVMGAKEG